ncbi:MAG: L-fuculokinase [Bacteroidota bacterium]
MKDLVLIFDCGATNVRVIAINRFGKIEASKSYPNATKEDPYFKGGLIWDVDEIWQKLAQASREVVSKIDKERITGVSVTTFGVDGTFINRNGEMVYPVISWQCERTHPIMDNIERYISREKLYRTGGVFPYGMNTINKIIWLKENKPEVIDQASDFLFMSALLLNRLSGERITNCTMAGTSMLMDARNRKISEEVLKSIGIDTGLFPEIREAGETAGAITGKAADETGIPKGTQVFVSGHDTQFAIYGSGAALGEPVLSSGTWEILMTRSEDFTAEKKQLDLGITTELDAIPGVYTIGLNLMGSGPLEWIRKMLYSTGTELESYEKIIGEAEQIEPGSNGIRINPDFAKVEKTKYPSGIFGLRLNTKREEVYRAGLEALSFKLRKGLDALEQAGGFKAAKIICVGGGSKNPLWNQIRADVINKPVQLIDQKETTVLGAALFGFAAAGIYKDAEEARNQIDYKPEIVKPSGNTSAYEKLKDSFLEYL